MIFVYGAPTCGKTFAITELSRGVEWPHPHFQSLEEIVDTSRKFNLFYKGYLLLDTDWLFPTVIKRFVDVKTTREAWEYWRSNTNNHPDIGQLVAKEFAQLKIDKCIVFTNLHMWEFGVDVPLRYARTAEDLVVSLHARDALKNYKRETPKWASEYVPPKGSIHLPMGTHMYPRIINDLARISPAFSTSAAVQIAERSSNTVFVYGAPTCGKSFAINKLSGSSGWNYSPFSNLEALVDAARISGYFYEGHLLLDTDWFFPLIIKQMLGGKTTSEARAYWKATHDSDILQVFVDEFTKLKVDKCVVFTNMALWKHGVDFALRYSRSREDLKATLNDRDVLQGRVRETPKWVEEYVPSPGSIILPRGSYIYPRIIEDLANISRSFQKPHQERLELKDSSNSTTEYFRLDDPHQLRGSYISNKLGKCLSQACSDSLAFMTPPSTKVSVETTQHRSSTSHDVQSLTLDFTETIRAAARDKSSSLLFEMSKVDPRGRNIGKNSVYQLNVKVVDGGGYTSLTLVRLYLTIPIKYEARSLRLAECSGWVPYSSPKREKRFKAKSYPFLTTKNEDSVVRVLNVNPKLGSSVQIHSFFQTKGEQSKFLDAQDASEGCFLCSYTLDLDANDGQCRPTRDELVTCGSDWGVTAQATLVAIVEASVKSGLPNYTRVKQTKT